MLILAVDVTGESNGPPGWSILSVIARMITHLGCSIRPVFKHDH